MHERLGPRAEKTDQAVGGTMQQAKIWEGRAQKRLGDAKETMKDSGRKP